MNKIKVVFVLLLSLVLVGCGTAPTETDNEGRSQTPITKGQRVFETNCYGCHSTANAKKVGLSLEGVFGKRNLPDGNSINDANMTHWLKTGNAKMPGFPNLSDSELTDLMTYLKTL